MTDGNLLHFRSGGAIKTVTPTVPAGIAPAVILFDPKYPHNVSAALRACSCYGLEQLWITGHRVDIGANRTSKTLRKSSRGKFRLPREERMKGYGDVTLCQYDRPFDMFPFGCPIAVEVLENCESLQTFDHPDDAVYVFGPEDGSLPPMVKRHCHRFVGIPARHCLNLAAAVYTVLYDRQAKTRPDLQLCDVLVEARGGVR